jgi:hypothetical protein
MKVELFGQPFCLPALISIAFLVIGIVGVVIDNTQDYTGANLAIAILQVVLVQYLCAHGHMKWAWFVLLIPLIMSIILLVTATAVVTSL